MFVHDFITMVDWIIATLVFMEIPNGFIHRLQKIRNKAARLVLGKGKDIRSDEILFRVLHWLPKNKRIIYKIAHLAFKCLNTTAPSYLCDLFFNPDTPKRSSKHNILASQSVKTIFQSKAFLSEVPECGRTL